MAKFQTPQFVDHEGKIIGPLTFRQAAYVGGPIPFLLLLFFIFPDSLLYIVILAVFSEAIGFTLGFVKVEGRTVPQILTNALFFSVKPKMYVWKRGKSNLHFKEMEYGDPEGQPEGIKKSDISQKSRIQNLAVQVQTKQ